MCGPGAQKVAFVVPVGRCAAVKRSHGKTSYTPAAHSQMCVPSAASGLLRRVKTQVQ